MIIKINKNKKVIIDDKDYNLVKDIKWYFSTGGYAIGRLNKKNIYMHRLIMNTPEGLETDHINRNKLDNRRSNLRICTRSQNLWNTVMKKNNTSGFKGIFKDKRNNKWCARICTNHKKTFLGYFNSKLEASKAYEKGSKIYHNEFAR